MTLALGLGVAFVGAAFVIAGVTDRPIGRLLFGNWDAPGSALAATAPGSNPGNAMTGGVYAPKGAPATGTTGGHGGHGA